MHPTQNLRSEFTYYSFFSFLVSFPVVVAYFFGINGYKISAIGSQFILDYNNVVLKVIFWAMLTLITTAFVFSIFLKKTITEKIKISKLEVFIYLLVCIFSYIGLLKSFSGFIFEASYAGPKHAWLGVGAWSLIFIFSFQFLLTAFYDIRNVPYKRLIIIFIIFTPVLLSGSRIDFISFILFEIIAFLFFNKSRTKQKVKYLSILFLSVLIVSTTIGWLRYSKEGHVSLSQQSDYIANSYQKNIVYLSTIGDLGTSMYQSIEYVSKSEDRSVNFFSLLSNYSIRMLPGFLFVGRPADVWVSTGINFGGGALHSFGEGYLFSEFFGVIFVCFIFGVCVFFSYRHKEAFFQNRDPLDWLIFAFPWMLIVRSGWYQFFSIFKGMEILMLFIFVSYCLRRYKHNF